jgi:uncharacterized protein YecT (DUF1311 family)
VNAIKPWFPVLLAVVLFLPRFGWSASFDCQRAETDTEWAICSTPELSSLDDKLAATYQELVAAPASSAQFGEKAEQLQIAWLHGRRDLCGGNVECLMSAYRDILSALQNLPYDAAALVLGKEGQTSIVPHCNDPADPMKASLVTTSFFNVVCSDPRLQDAVRRIEAQARQLQPRLPLAWRVTFDEQEAAFPTLTQQCPQAGKALERCVAIAIQQRLQDLTDLAYSLDTKLPDCMPADLSIKDSGLGDAGMSKVFNAYLLEYRGIAPCRIRGYPSIRISAANGRAMPDYAIYSGTVHYASRETGAPLPITFSPKSRHAWFGIETATACDDVPGGFNVKVALPLSQEWLDTLKFPQANCSIAVTPVNMISTLRSSVN